MPNVVLTRTCLVPAPPTITARRLMCVNNKIIQSVITALENGTAIDCDFDDVLESCRCISGSEDDFLLAQSQLICQLSDLIAQMNININNITSGVSGLLYGSGSPEGVKAGKRGWMYTDMDTGTKYSYVNPVDGLTTGWV